MDSFFDKNYVTPKAIAKRISRRRFLKSAAMSSALTALPSFTLSATSDIDLSQEPWQTLDTVMQHLLPSSDSGPGASDIMAINYLANVINEQPIEEEEKQFIKNGVGWLNGFTEKNHQKKFAALSKEDKQAALQAISRSRAGENWLSTLISYIFEAMLAPESYGGNPNGIGWKWLNHKPGFPMPEKGKRYYELTAYGTIDSTDKTQAKTKVRTTENKQVKAS